MCIALDLPGFGGSEMPAGEISIRASPRAVDAVCDAARDRRAGRDRQLDGRLRRRRAGALVPDAGRSSCSCRRRACRPSTCARAAARRRAASPRYGAPGCAAARGQPAAAAAGSRSRSSCATRSGCRSRSPRSSSRGAGTPGLPRRPSRRCWATRSATGSAEIEVPTLIVWGATTCSSRSRTRGVRAPDRRQRPRRRLRRHRPPGDARAPARFNELLAGFIAGERATRDAASPGRQRVTAPSEALDTSFAYLASTPRVVGSGGS